MSSVTRKFGNITLIERDGQPVVAHEPFTDEDDDSDYMALLDYLKQVAPDCALQWVDTPNGFAYVIYRDRDELDALRADVLEIGGGQ